MYRTPHDQIKEQLRLIIEQVKERQESELINNSSYGLLHNVHESMSVKPRKGAPTPDDLDELLAKVWKESCFFLAHPTRERVLEEVQPQQVQSESSSLWRCPCCAATMVLIQRLTAAKLATCMYFDSS
jgi:Phage capsid-like protein